MGAGREQPSILESMRVRSDKFKPARVGGDSINMLTGSVKVAASQSNTVLLDDASLGGDRVATDASLERAASQVDASREDPKPGSVDASLEACDDNLEATGVGKLASERSQANLMVPKAKPVCQKPGDSLKSDRKLEPTVQEVSRREGTASTRTLSL